MLIEKPRVSLIGATCINVAGLREYLEGTDQLDFMDSVAAAKAAGYGDDAILIAFMAKLCYKSLVMGKNPNVLRVRDIGDNLRNVRMQAHGSVLRHFTLNFVATDCSRIFTHEAVRHHLGFDVSQTSGRFVSLSGGIDIVWDPCLDPIRDMAESMLSQQEVWYRVAMARLCEHHSVAAWTDMPFSLRKKLTSALRRVTAGGQVNELGFTINGQALPHLLMMRTAPGAEWEIREVFGQVYKLVKAAYPMMVDGLRTRMVDDQLQVYGMRLQPYESLLNYTTDEIRNELERRNAHNDHEHGPAYATSGVAC